MSKDYYYEPKYYPLIDTDDSGKDKGTMFPTTDYKKLDADEKPYLMEIISHVFRTEGISGDVTIRCPYCGKKLENITENAGKSIYVCKNCGF